MGLSILGNFKAMKGVLSLSLFNNVSYHCLLYEVSSKSFINNSYLRHNVKLCVHCELDLEYIAMCQGNDPPLGEGQILFQESSTC